MPSLKSIRKRITSVKNTQKITRAMKLVAAARLRRAQDAVFAARPYAESLEQVIGELAGVAGSDAHPLLTQKQGKRVQLILMTSDRGLAGSFNAQIIRAVENYIADDLAGFEVSLRVVGRKGNDYFKRRKTNIVAFKNAPVSETALDLSRDIADAITNDFLGSVPNGSEPARLDKENAKVDRVILVYNKFMSVMSQEVTFQQLLPVEPRLVEQSANDSQDFIYEPGKEQLLEHLLPLYVRTGLFRAALESIASEFGSRMSAMDSATRNAGEMIGKLTLQYNRARQAAITKELLEIISGAESLKG